MTVGIVKSSKFLRMARSDPEMVKITNMLENGNYLVDSSALIKEMKSMHSIRSASTVSAKKLLESRNLLMDRVLETQAHRSRCVAIKVDLHDIKDTLDKQLHYMSKHLATKYAAQLVLEFSTAKARNDAVAVALNDISVVKADIDRVQYIADLLIEDLDKTGFNNNQLTKIFEVIRSREA